jgi:SnoaL-like domain
MEELLAREAIRHTIASYTMAGDRLKAEELAAQFTDDGVLESEGVQGADLFRNDGRAAIRAWLAGWGERAARVPAARRPTFVRHHISTSRIEFTDAATAQGRTYWVAYTDIGPDHGGYYLDTFRKVGARWLIAHRRVRMDWRVPASLFGDGPP